MDEVHLGAGGWAILLIARDKENHNMSKRIGVVHEVLVLLRASPFEREKLARFDGCYLTPQGAVIFSLFGIPKELILSANDRLHVSNSSEP